MKERLKSLSTVNFLCRRNFRSSPTFRNGIPVIYTHFIAVSCSTTFFTLVRWTEGRTGGAGLGDFGLPLMAEAATEAYEAGGLLGLGIKSLLLCTENRAYRVN